MVVQLEREEEEAKKKSRKKKRKKKISQRGLDADFEAAAVGHPKTDEDEGVTEGTTDDAEGESSGVEEKGEGQTVAGDEDPISPKEVPAKIGQVDQSAKRKKKKRGKNPRVLKRDDSETARKLQVAVGNLVRLHSELSDCRRALFYLENCFKVILLVFKNNFFFKL